MRNPPVVGDVDNCLFTLIANKFHLVLGRENRLDVLLASGVPDAHLDGTRIPLFRIDASVLEEQGVATMALDGVRAIKDTLTPAFLAAVQGIRSFILSQLILTSVQVLDETVLDPVGDAPDGGAVVRGVVLDIMVLCGEAQNDVFAADAELLDDGAQGQEGEFSLFGGGHRGCCCCCRGCGWS